MRGVPARLLSLLPHSTDAAVRVGGTLARYADAGCEIVVLSATGRETGDTDATAPPVRELHAAARVLGVRDVLLLDYPAGSLSVLEPDILEDLLFDLIRAVEPDVVITVGGEAINGATDQAAVHEAARGAFFRARSLRGGGSGSRPAKLYFCASAVQHERRALRLLQARGVSTTAIPGASPGAGSETAPGISVANPIAVSTIIDVRPTLSRKLEAVRQHTTHLDPAFFELDAAALDDLWGQEFFVRIFPHPWITGVIERDLLAGLAPMTPAWRLAS